MSIGTCKFCGQEKKLIDAHIVPKSFYLGLKEKDKYLSINSRTAKYTIQQKGGYDKNILCETCDSKVGCGKSQIYRIKKNFGNQRLPKPTNLSFFIKIYAIYFLYFLHIP